MKLSWRISAIPLLLAIVGLVLTTGCPNPAPVVSITSEPPGAAVVLDAKSMGTTPWQSDVRIGEHHVQVTLEGYRPWEQRVTLEQSRFYEFHAALVPLQGTLEVDVTPAGAAVTVDDAFTFAQTPCSLLLSPGEHRVTVTAPDHQPQTWTVTIQDAQVTRLEGTLAPLIVSPSPEPTSSPTSTPSPAPEPEATATPLPTQPPSVRTWETTVSIPTYQYEDALYPAGDIPYPRLDFARVGPPAPKEYRAIVVENRYLQLTFLPDLGGRLYRCVFKPTGHDIFYRNPVIKPTHWGPDEMGWWIAAGGMEWCFPVWEHGYTTALPWQCQARREADGSVAFVAEHDEKITGLHVSVAVTLRPDRGDFEIRPTVSNPTGQSQTYKLWINALLGLEADRLAARVTRFSLPVSEVVVHSTGDAALPPAGARMSWPVYADRDFSYYVNWNDYLGVFAAPPAPTWAGVYNVEMGAGIVRVRPADPQATPGVKLFAFGPNQDPAAYTDGDSWYCELWSGATPDFDQAVTIAPGETHTWTERWFPVGDVGGLHQATEQAALRLDHGVQSGTLLVGVATPARLPGTVVVLVEGSEIYREECSVSPDRPFHAQVVVPDSVPAAGLVTLRFLDDQGQVVAQAERWMTVR